MKYFASKIVIALLLNLSIVGLCYADLVVNSGANSLNNELYWFKTADKLVIDQVAKLPLSRFEKPLGRAFSDGYSKSDYWFRFTLDFSKVKKDRWLLEIPFALLDHVTLFEPVSAGGFKKTVTGDRLPFSERPTPLHHFVFPITSYTERQTYFIHVKTQDSVQVPLVLWSESDYLPHYGKEIGIQMAFFGAMIVMVIYNIFIYFSTRDKSYILYVVFILLMIIFQMGLQGFSHKYLWPDNPWMSNISTAIFGVLSLFFGLFFVRSLLKTKLNIPRFDRVLLVVSYTMLIGIWLTLFAEYDLAIAVSIVTTSIFFNLALVAIILLVLKGHRTAKIVLAAWAVFLLSGSISMLGITGFLPLEFANIHTLQIGSTVEVVLLSLALADRIKFLRQEKIDMEVMSSDVLRLANEQLEKSNRMKDAFIATISHEVKTPMNAILGSAQLLKDNSLSPEKKQYVEVIERSGSLLLGILDNILEYSKLEAGKVVTIERDTDIVKLCEDVTELFDVQLRKKPVRIWLSYSDDLPETVYIDDVLLKHVIMNLISNAVKFTQQGFIWLHVSMGGKDRLIIEVTDSGIGMNQDQVKRIFKAFMQADDSTSRTYGGTGLGLIISKRICELLDGDIKVKSQEGVGTSFYANISMTSLSTKVISPELPLNIRLNNKAESELFQSRFQCSNSYTPFSLSVDSDNSVVVSSDTMKTRLVGVLSAKSIYKICGSLSSNRLVPDAKNRSKVKTLGVMNVLAVDDDTTNRMIISKILEKLGVNFKVVSSGEEAIKSINDNGFDVVLMDIEMPEMDGFEATRCIRKSEQLENRNPIKIVALSAHSTREFKEKARFSGMDEFISKPVKISDLELLLK